MRILMVEQGEKICHFAVGDVVELPNAVGFYMICADENTARESGTNGAGLYREPRRMFLVNLETGVARAMPHLSSRAIRRNDVALMDVKAS